uniref:Lipid droplet assembly factor 1 n=1 Tax=Latimeria chalumnae TaxID=7897 RepID=H3AS98_LATCH
YEDRSKGKAKGIPELQRRLQTILNNINHNTQVVAFMNSALGKYLDGHPFLALVLLVFIVLSAVPVGLFLSFAVFTSIIGCVGFIFWLGFVLSVGTVVLLSVLCGSAVIAFALSVVLSMSYAVLSSVLNYYYSPR